MVTPEQLTEQDPYWLFDGIPAKVESPQHVLEPGKKIPFELTFKPDARNEAIGDHAQNYANLQQRGEQLKAVNADTTIHHKVLYSVPPLIEVEPEITVIPGPYDPVGKPFWGLLRTVDDGTMLSNHIAELSIEVMYVADYDAYNTKDEFRSEHKRTAFH